jgi:hypothetical protein
MKTDRTTVAFILFLVIVAAVSCGGDTPGDLSAIRTEAESLAIVQGKLAWFSQTVGEESVMARTYSGHEDLFSLDTIRYVGKQLAKASHPDSVRALRFLRDYITAEYIGLDVAHFDDETQNREATAKVKLPWLPDSTAYRDLPLLIANEKDPDRRLGLFQAQAEVWSEVLNPVLEEKEERVRTLSREVGYSDYVALSEELRFVDLKELVRVGREFLEETDDIYRDLLGKQSRRVLGIPPEKLTRADIGRLSQDAYFNRFFPAELVVPFFRHFVEDMGLQLNTLAGTPILINDDTHPKKDPRAACFAIVVPRDVRITVKPSGGVPDMETFFHEGGHALHFGFASTTVWEFQQTGNNTSTETYAILLEDLFGDPDFLDYYSSYARDYNRKQSKRVPLMSAGDKARLLENRMFWDIYFVRRYAGAKPIYETILHGGDPDIYAGHYEGERSNLKAVYRDLFSQAYGFDIGSEGALRYLTDVDPFFYSADYARAFFLADQLAEHLRKKFGDRWYTNDAVGPYLRDNFFTHGQKLQEDELAAAAGFDRLDPAAKHRKVVRVLDAARRLAGS